MNVHVIIGSDDYLVEESAKKFVVDGAGLEIVDSLNSSNAELQLGDLRAAEASLMTPPFLEPVKVTWWKNVHFLPGGRSEEGRGKSDEGGAKSTEVKEALEKFARRLAEMKLPENQRFVLSGPHLLKTSTFAKVLSGVADMVTFAAEKPWEAQRNATVRAIDYAAEEGLKFDHGAAELFVSVVGTDARSLRGELSKLRDYLGSGATRITTADISEITSQGVKDDPEVWDITDALGERDAGKVLAAVRRFEGGSGYVVLVTGVIERFFRQLIDVQAGRTESINPYSLRKLSAALRRWTLPELRRARWRFLELREKSVSSGGNVEAMMITEILRTCRRRR